jgi:hypothetical protein
VPGQEIITSGGGFQSARPAVHVSVREDENLPSLNPYALVWHSGRTRGEIQLLDKSKSGSIDADRRPEGQRTLEYPIMECRIRTRGLTSQQNLRLPQFEIPI